MIKITGSEAIAHGAIEANVRVVTGYPGSPSTKVLENILSLSKGDTKRHIEWSVNEKVAFEIALGASIAGSRAMVCLKSVGMNITVDPIMTANLTGINAGLLILLGDDPGAQLSQNEQDTRLLAEFFEIPVIEPSSLQEGKEMVSTAFDISEEFELPVILRIIRKFSVLEGLVEQTKNSVSREPKRFIREKNRWISTTFNVKENHRNLHEKLEKLAKQFDNSEFNKIVGKAGKKCIIAAGFSYNKLNEILAQKGTESLPDEFAILKLGTINPVPKKTIIGFLGTAESVLLLEDNEPYIENKIKAIAQDAGLGVKIIGKTTGHVPREGELSKEELTFILADFGVIDKIPKEVLSGNKTEKFETQKTFCDGCPYTSTFHILSQIIDELKEKPIIIAEPGCGVKLNAPPFEMLDIKYSMGSAIGIASGITKTEEKVKPIAVCGDSSFFHTGVNALMNLVSNKANIFILVLDNSVTALTGYQPHPGTGLNTKGQQTPKIEIAEVAKICNVPFIAVVDPDDKESMENAFYQALNSDALSMVVVKKPCPLAIESNKV